MRHWWFVSITTVFLKWLFFYVLSVYNIKNKNMILQIDVYLRDLLLMCCWNTLPPEQMSLPIGSHQRNAICHHCFMKARAYSIFGRKYRPNAWAKPKWVNTLCLTKPYVIQWRRSSSLQMIRGKAIIAWNDTVSMFLGLVTFLIVRIQTYLFTDVGWKSS